MPREVGARVTFTSLVIVYVLGTLLGWLLVPCRDAWAGMRRLKGLTLGLVGVNASGRAVARRALAFGMKIVYCDLESVSSLQIPASLDPSNPICAVLLACACDGEQGSPGRTAAMQSVA